MILGVCVGLMVGEDKWRNHPGAWGYSATNVAERGPWTSVYPLYGLVMLINVVITTLVMVLYLGFKVVIAGRRKYKYKLPTMYAAADILRLDVDAGGKLLSGGDAAKARKRFDDAMKYNCHQRAHHQPLESYTSFVALSLLGGLRYPAVTAFWGLLWVVGRIVWANGYASGSGKPRDRYRHGLAHMVWLSLFGVLFTAAGTGIGVLTM